MWAVGSFEKPILDEYLITYNFHFKNSLTAYVLNILVILAVVLWEGLGICFGSQSSNILRENMFLYKLKCEMLFYIFFSFICKKKTCV